MLACKRVTEIEDLFLKVPIAYAVNVNVGYFGDEASLETRFIKNVYEYDTVGSDLPRNQKTLEHETPIVLNYEIAPSALNAKLNRLSKHCLVSSEAYSRLSSSGQDGNGFEPSMFSANHYFHFNHFERIKIEECVINSSRYRGKRSQEYLTEIGTIRSAQELLTLASDCKNEEYPIFRSIGKSKIHPIATAVFDLKARMLSIYVGKPTENDVFLKIPMEYKC